MTSLLLALSSTAFAGVTRFAIVVGNNEGAPDTRPLYFSEYDAEKMYRVFTDLGGVAPENATLLLGTTRNKVLHAMGGLRQDVAEAQARGDETVVLFYYSGHADRERLQLGRTWVTYEELDHFLTYSGADVRMAFLDACQSGAMTRAKGGERAPSFVFELSERLDAEGQVVITSSAGDEASQESDEIGGSYFTHFLASALTGAGDEDRDGKVTLTEAYRYVYDETVFQTKDSAHGTQHPTYEWDLAGKGDVVLTDLGQARASLVFSPAFVGRYAVFDRDRREFVAELELDGADERRVSLRPGTYLIQERFPTHLKVAEVNLRDGQAVDLDSAAFAAVEYEDDVAKGTVEKKIRRARMPRLSLHVLAGGRTFTEESVQLGYFPSTLAAGAQARWNFLDHKWVAADVVSGAGSGLLTIEGLSYQVPVHVTGTTFGVSGGYATGPRFVQVGGGLRLAGAYLSRSFPDQGVPRQDLFTVAPGLVGWLGLHPGAFEVELEVRSHYLPYIIDERDKGLAFNEALLTLGYRF